MGASWFIIVVVMAINGQAMSMTTFPQFGRGYESEQECKAVAAMIEARLPTPFWYEAHATCIEAYR